jgi:hypothetical protein
VFSYIGAPYLFGFLVTVLVGVLMTNPQSRASDRRTGARLLLLSPVWPLPAALALIRGIAEVWKLADWRRP